MIPRVDCSVGQGWVRVELRRNGRTTWAAETEWTTSASLREAVAHLAGRAELPAIGRRIRFSLEEALLQRRTLVGVPPVSRRALADLVALAPHRYFRRGGGDLVTDSQWLGRGKGRIGVAVAAERGVIDALLAGAREAGLLVTGVGPAAGEGSSFFQLLPNDERLRRRASDLSWTLRIGVAAVIAWVALGMTLLVADLLERRDLERRLAEIREPLAAVLEVESRVDSVTRMVARLDREAVLESELVGKLFQVATALPDSSFLTQLRVDSSGVGMVAGAARRPTAVLAALEGRAGVVKPRFEGRTTRDVVGGRPVERFSIGFGPAGGSQ